MYVLTKFIRRQAVFLFVLVVLLSPIAERSAEASLIRDAELENTIRTYATPLFEAAGLNASDVRIYIIADDSLNAFVAGGMNLFMNTGLLLRTRNANEVVGVMAHETGHISGGHLARFGRQIEASSRTAMAATILGILTAIATGSGDAGAAIAHGGSGVAMGTILSYSRAQESAADQAGLNLLEQTGQSARGLADFLRTIEGQELLTEARQDPYVRTHPITRERIAHVNQHLKKSRFTDASPPAGYEEMHERMQAKIRGFLHPPVATLSRYGKEDDSVAARYARSIAYFRLADLDRALPLIDDLIREEPDNPYFHELKGQVLFESGRIAEARAPYEDAVSLKPDSALMRVELARSQLASEDQDSLREALAHLHQATRIEPHNAFAWQQLAIAYGRDGQFGESALAQAEAALARGDRREALAQAARAESRLEIGTSAWVRVQDIKNVARDLHNQ